MISSLKTYLKKRLNIKVTPKKVFLQNRYYLEITQRRLEHLANLGLDFTASLLEAGAGGGALTGFFLARASCVTCVDAREENLELLKSQHPAAQVKRLDFEQPDHTLNDTFDIICCYGLLYHLGKPANAIQFMSEHCRKMLLLETRVSSGDGEFLNPSSESTENPALSFSGHCCEPTRKWVYRELKRNFEFVYLPLTQPNHVEFPIDWTALQPRLHPTRSIFIASRHQLTNPLLTEEIPVYQTRC